MKKESNHYSHIKALYLEDDKLIRTIVCEHLEGNLSELLIAENGNEGLSLFKSHNPNLIITDLNMPVMSGIEFIKKIRLLDQTIPIIVTSALTDVDSFIKSIELKVDKYILKPFSPDEILGAIDVLSRQVILSQLNATSFHLEDISEEQLTTLQVVLRNSFSAIVKEIIGKGAPRINIKIKNNFLELYLYENFLPYEYSLSTTVYDVSFINSLRKSVYENFKQKIERKLSYSTGLNINLEDIQVSMNNSVEKFIFSIKNSEK
ncbi:response regulator [Fusibacter bizertensis]|uniref:Stage 0 sporulation protein A homolog n=1 Tax=Fusibacter bizertensis TaxID=1488331 RepID=A0ABT6NF08_9FIRM|nr:response regulator [Fusibacter bizertensis]MDH8679013.1 response regulator [Fusibacter bizertensis]